MTNNKIKALVAAAFVLPLLVIGVLSLKKPSPTVLGAYSADAAADYKAKCAMCHTAKAEKFFDPAKPIEAHTQAILKGVKTAKPPMPAYEEKGMTAEQARALAEYMVQLRTPGSGASNTNAVGNTNTTSNTNGAGNTSTNQNGNTSTNQNGNTSTNQNGNITTNVNTSTNSNASSNANASSNSNTSGNVADGGESNTATGNANAGTTDVRLDEQLAASYKSKCAMCHTAKAEKFFDPAKSDEVLSEIVLKGVKTAKPPMPAYAERGMKPEEAVGLVGYMRGLREARK